MSSVLRKVAVKKESLTRFVKLDTPVYSNGEYSVLFPFSYSNQVLDISYEGNNFKTEMVDVLNQDPSGESTTVVRILSGPFLATELGGNFKAYIRAWRDGTIDEGSPIEMYIAPQLLRVQEASYDNLTADNGNPYKISTVPPTNDFFVTGSAATNYNEKYVFKTPLTFTIKEGGVTQYITFRSSFDQE